MVCITTAPTKFTDIFTRRIIQVGSVVNCSANKSCKKLKVSWIPHQLSKYKDDSHNKPHHCFKEQTNFINETYCLNFSSYTNNQYYYIYLRENMQGFSLRKEMKLSWNSASSLCKKIGGYLPILRSRSEMDKFIALVTFSQYIPPQDEIFIGLPTNIESKVIIHKHF